MEVGIIRDRQDNLTFRQSVVQNIAERFQTRFNPADNENKTETLILPVVPEDLEFPRKADITNLKGIHAHYNLPGRTNLHSMTIESFFPVNKSYSWLKSGANRNGFDYVDFLDERRDSQKPFRLIAYEINNRIDLITSEIETTSANGGLDVQRNGAALFKVHCDMYFLVKEFRYKIDKTGDIKYTLNIEQFNETKQDELPIDWSQAVTNATVNHTVRTTLKIAGLI